MTHNKLLKKITQILILATLISAIFAACDEADVDADTDTTDVETETAVLEEIEDTRIYPDLPEYDWDGYNFRILAMGESGDSEWNIQCPRDIDAEEETGEPLNDAIYYRNRNLEEKYNFTIEQAYFFRGAMDPVRAAVMSGDDYFDVTSESPYVGASVKEGLFVDLFTLKYLDLEKPWWDQELMKNAAVTNKLFFISGDSVLMNRDATTVMLFNKELIEDYNLENPYELVRSNQWTFAKFSEMASTAMTDLNGDQKMDSTVDRFGHIASLTNGIVIGGGVRYAEIDKDGMPYLTFADERNYNVIYAAYDIFYSEFTTLANGGWGIIGESPLMSQPEGIFAAGRGLFFSAIIRTIESLRGAETDFGILPMPKFDEEQKKWVHTVDTLFGQVLCVPNFGNDEALERTGFMLEAIASESTYTVIPAWYEVQLTSKFARDAESKEMLDIIFSSVEWDSYRLYGWGDFNSMWSAWTGTVASDWSKSLKKTETEMKATIKAFEKLD